ncbi:rod shape-determining protein MreC [Sulfurimonas lithotrophica]|uniref:Rod shape-determining protein MreC n=1 Tax=Sulfurimonas lithotrophica TaxID=2590022 RepID=A0A5P8NZY0_9BACT|nr:rod shape-determining protein MreC [Sulfurimonas lithotrophica]QFR48910.1 rod shape-determining protein MreC [Sulfurimonas lithotrophica]
MNKELLSFFLIFIALFVGAMYYTNIIQGPFISALNYVKSTYHDTVEYASENIDKHFFQTKQIEELKEKLEKYENNHLVMQQLASEVNDLFSVNKTTLKTNPKVELVRAISYKRFGDLNRLWIEMDDFNSSKIYGLTYKELVAGIVVSNGDKPLAILNRDRKCTYAVYVGDKKAPGVANGNDEKNIMVEYIPSWFKIKKGDLVTTSGLDDIFFKGLKVGTVLSVTKSQGYQSAVVEPYYDSSEPSYFHLIKSVK